MNRKLVIKRAVIWMLSMMITLCSASPVWATEAAPAAAAAENLAEPGNGKTEEIKPAETNLSEAKPEDANPPGEKPGETAPPAEKPAPEKEKEKSPSGSGESEGSGKLTVDGYEVYAALSGNSPIDAIRKGKNVKLVVSVRAEGLTTEEAGKNGITVSKLSDSFRNAGAAKVKVTSKRDENLEFTVTIPKAVYSGRGNELRLRVNYKKSGIPSETITAEISECEEYEGKGDNSEDATGQPVIRIKRISPQTAVGSGESFGLELELENTSKESDIEDLIVNISPGNGLYITDDTGSQVVSSLGLKQKKKITVRMTAGQELAGPSQSVDIEMKYNYYSGGSLTSGSLSQKVQIPVRGGAAGQPLIRIGRGRIDRPVNAGETFQMVIRLENTSQDKDIRNLTATIEPNDQIYLLDETDTRLLGELKAGTAVDIPVRLQAGAELSQAASQLLGLSLKFDYDSDKGSSQGTIAEKLVIPTNGKSGKMNIPTPNIIIRNYSYGEKVTAGQVFDLEMEMTNTSSVTAAENVVVSLDTGEGISINSSSNTIYIPKLDAGAAKKQSIKVQALFQSKLQSPKITISFKYEYLDGKERKQATSSETIAIPVYQPDRFELKSPVYSENFRQNEEATISIPYVNKGRGQVFNVEAKLEGDIPALEKDLTLGNFEAGKSGTIDFVVTPKKTGKVEGKIRVSYEDEAMQQKTEEIPISVEVMEAQNEQADFSEKDEMARPRGTVLWPATALAVLLATALFAAAKARKKIRDRKMEDAKREEQDDDWDDVFPEDEGGEEDENGTAEEEQDAEERTEK